MKDSEGSPKFWLGNGVLALALLMLVYMGKLWEMMGAMAMGLWIAVAMVGVYLLMSDKKEPPSMPK
jgi:hypothetical protein